MTQLTSRPYSAAHFGLELDSQNLVGFLRSLEGGNLKADVMTYQMGSTSELWKQAGRPKYEDIKVQCGMAMSGAFYEWIAEFFAGKQDRRNGAILAADFWYVERARRRFQDALISEIAFPKVDAADKNPAYMTVTIVPEILEFQKGSGARLPVEPDPTPEKLWTACNFDFQIDQFPDACNRVSKVDGWSLKCKVLEYQTGSRRESIRVPGRTECPNLSFYVPESDAEPFFKQVTARVHKGEPAPDTRFTAELRMKSNDGGTDLCTIEMKGVDIVGVTPDKGDAGGEEIKQVKVEISVEAMEFLYGTNAQLE
jgi:phage tail-like protein